MAFKAWRALIVLVVTLATMASCTSSASPETPPSTAERPVDYRALNAAIENKITSGSVALDNVRAVLISVDGETKIVLYRHRFTAEDTTHVWSVTKTVVSTLIGIAISDGLIDSLDQTLAESLAQHRAAMSAGAEKVTLRQLMTMTGGFGDDPPHATVRKIFKSQDDLVSYLLAKDPVTDAGTVFAYSNTSSHLVAAVLATALQGADGDHPRPVLDYARERLFDPLQIDTRPAYSKPLLHTAAAEFVDAGFGWGTDPKGIAVGAFGGCGSEPSIC
jgi:CubicO group peptidase (beta-lactamase class C family)